MASCHSAGMMVAGNTGGGDSVVALAAWYALANLLALAEFHLVERPSRINLEDTREAQRVGSKSGSAS